MIEIVHRFADSGGVPHVSAEDAAAAEILRAMDGRFVPGLGMMTARAIVANRDKIEAIFAELDRVRDQDAFQARDREAQRKLRVAG